MATYPLPSLAPTIDATGIKALSYSDIYQSLIASFQQIYGSSIYIAPDSQDGQWLAVLAKGYYDVGQQMVAAFNTLSPTYAQGAGLSSLLKINGLNRIAATNSTAVGNCIGVAGTLILGGLVKDTNGNVWSLPPVVNIPTGGSISVTVTSTVAGAISALAGTINQISNPQYGWQSFTSTTDAAVGVAVETDYAARSRQKISTALPALSNIESIYSAVGNVPGVTRFTVYENDTGVTDVNGLPAHSISPVVYGGDISAIGTVIAKKKAVGVQTYGTTSVTVYDQFGLPTVANFFVLAIVPIYFAITIKALPGYVSTTGVALQNALAAFINSLAIGEDIYVSQAQAAAGLIGQQIGQTFYIQSFALGTAPTPVGTSNLTIAFNAASSCVTGNIGLTVV